MIVTAASTFLVFYLIVVFVYSRHWSDLTWPQRLTGPFSIAMSIVLFVIVSPCLYAVKLSADINKDINRRNIRTALTRGKRYGLPKD